MGFNIDLIHIDNSNIQNNEEDFAVINTYGNDIFCDDLLENIEEGNISEKIQNKIYLNKNKTEKGSSRNAITCKYTFENKNQIETINQENNSNKITYEKGKKVSDFNNKISKNLYSLSDYSIDVGVNTKKKGNNINDISYSSLKLREDTDQIEYNSKISNIGKIEKNKVKVGGSNIEEINLERNIKETCCSNAVMIEKCIIF